MESDRDEEVEIDVDVDVSSVQESPQELSFLSWKTFKLHSLFKSFDDAGVDVGVGGAGGVQWRIPRLLVFVVPLLLLLLLLLLLQLRAIIGLWNLRAEIRLEW